MKTSISIAGAILEATTALRNAGIPEPRREAGTLLAHVLGRERTFIITHTDDIIDDASLKRFAQCVERRAKGEPLQYITGRQQFFGLDFQVNPAVLIPRPETELLVEAALQLLPENDQAFICDVGTGSGCIVVALLHARTMARAVAVDISPAAIQVANINALNHGVGERVDFLVANGLGSLAASVCDFDLIISNPPYVSASALKGLQREVRDHEPRIALRAGDDGLSAIRQLLEQGSNYLSEGGYLLFEIGFDQGDRVREMVDYGVWTILDIQPDLQGIPRMVVLKRRSQYRTSRPEFSRHNS